MKAEIKKVKVRKAYLCDKCGKRLGITVAPYLRHRMDLCICDGVAEKKKK